MSIFLAFLVATVSILWIVIVSRIVRAGRAPEPDTTEHQLGDIL